ncbi:uncharacterized protein [Penaeus vannamei]|uniref:uncharacterized protein n=1 Tax=Penaeus vannamei TaxID=6689 RepID=UPI00387F6509
MMVFTVTLMVAIAPPTAFANDTTVESSTTRTSSTTQVSATTWTTTEPLITTEASTVTEAPTTTKTTEAFITTEASATTKTTEASTTTEAPATTSPTTEALITPEASTTTKTTELSNANSTLTETSGTRTSEPMLLGENMNTTTTAEIPLNERYSCFANLSALLYGAPETIRTTGGTTENGGLWGNEGTCAEMTCPAGEVFSLSSKTYGSVGVCCHEGAWLMVEPALDVNGTLDHPWAGCYSEPVCTNYINSAKDTIIRFPGDVTVWSLARRSKIAVDAILSTKEKLLVLGLSASQVTFTCHDTRSLMFYTQGYTRSVFVSFQDCDLEYTIPSCVPVCKTTGGSPCRFPFVWGGSEHRNCTDLLPAIGPSCSHVYNVSSDGDLMPCDLSNETSACGDSEGVEDLCGGGPVCDVIISLDTNVTMIEDSQLPDVTPDDVIPLTYRVRGCHGESFKLVCDKADQNLWVKGDRFGIYYPWGSKRFSCLRRFGIDSFFGKESSNEKPQTYESYCADKEVPATTKEGIETTTERRNTRTTAVSTAASTSNPQKTGTASTETKKMGVTTTELQKTVTSGVSSSAVTEVKGNPISELFPNTTTPGTTTESVHTTAFTTPSASPTVTARERYPIDEENNIGGEGCICDILKSLDCH